MSVAVESSTAQEQMTNVVLQTDRLTKRFGQRVAVEHSRCASSAATSTAFWARTARASPRPYLFGSSSKCRAIGERAACGRAALPSYMSAEFLTAPPPFLSTCV